MRMLLISFIAVALISNCTDYGEQRTCCDGSSVAYCNADGNTVCTNGKVDYSCPCKK